MRGVGSFGPRKTEKTVCRRKGEIDMQGGWRVV